MFDIGEINRLTPLQYVCRGAYFGLVSLVILPGSALAVRYLLASPWDALYILPVAFLATSLGANTACHMYFTHRSFTAARWFHVVLAFLATILCQDSIIQWVANHKRHHRHVDVVDKDPHTPWQFGMQKWKAATVGVLWASAGWKFSSTLTSKKFYAKQLMDDSVIRWFDRHFVFISLSVMAFPAVIGWMIGGLPLALKWFAYFSALRVFIGYFFTEFVVNGLCHVFGSKKFDVRGRSTNLMFMAPLTLGATLHHNHHAFPRVLSPAIDGELDTMQIFYWLLKKIKCIVVTENPSEEEILAKRLS